MLKLSLPHSMKLCRGCSGIDPLIPNSGTRWGQVVNFMPWPLQKIILVLIEQEAGWVPEPLWTFWRRENLFLLPESKIWFILPVLSQLYWLSYLGSQWSNIQCIFCGFFLMVLSNGSVNFIKGHNVYECAVFLLLPHTEFKLCTAVDTIICSALYWSSLPRSFFLTLQNMYLFFVTVARGEF